MSQQHARYVSLIFRHTSPTLFFTNPTAARKYQHRTLLEVKLDLSFTIMYDSYILSRLHCMTFIETTVIHYQSQHNMTMATAMSIIY